MRILVIAFFAISIGWAVPAPVEADSDTILLGSVLSLSGKYEARGLETQNGYELAISRVNDMGGVLIDGKSYKLKIKYLDDASDRKQAAELAERLIKRDGIKFMLGPYSSSITFVVSYITERHKVPMVIAEADASSIFKRGFNYIFGVRTTGDQYFVSAIDLAAELAEKKGRKPSDLKVAVLSERDPFSDDVRMGAIGAAKRYGMTIVIDDKIPMHPSDISSSLLQVKSAEPDILLFKGRTTGAETFARQIEEMRIEVPLIVLSHCEAARIIEKIGEAANGLLCVTQWSPALSYEDKVFGKAIDYLKKLKEVPIGPWQSAAASAAILVYKDAFERAGSLDAEKVRAALAATDLPTFFGHIKFAQNGQSVAKPMVLRQIQNGEFRVVAPTTWAPSTLKHPRQSIN